MVLLEGFEPPTTCLGNKHSIPLSYKSTVKKMTDYEKLSQLLVPFLQPNTYLILQGKLGVGKTTLVRFLAKNLGIAEKIISPTFNILQRYPLKNDYYLNHFDFFRLTAADTLDFFSELATDNLNIIE
ncbi:13771_t:CDS:2 [Gigaspora margarita]|uniref:tRNA threonylcarbamoyladenosine biosynthesis protein TsaE n=1 Tax=Gigaspora margarita TaxID=4874 RepID=A0ABM8VZU4_GIGMA|nr:13771_t:CDS:2 [Gigaspora margarita]